jgi:hypothetical protein
VPVDRISTRPREQAIRQKGLFANQNSACKLRNRFTLDILYPAFGVDDASPPDAAASSYKMVRRPGVDVRAHPFQHTAATPGRTAVPRATSWN